MQLEKIIKKFINDYIDPQRSVLLALSGGPDSTALFHLLLNEGLFFHVAHINHNWRPESGHEENFLRLLCKKKDIPFHSKEIFPHFLKKGNLEDLCRNERLLFFKEIIEKENLQGVILAHHSDDLAETVLKRLFEGAALSQLKGLTTRSVYKNLILLRPLLSVTKKKILQWLDLHKHEFFLDPSNEDTFYLRARLRKELFPQLSKQFGKEIVPSLTRISQASFELYEFLEHFLDSYRKKIVQEDKKLFIDLSSENNTPSFISTPFAYKAILKDFFSHAGLVLSNPTLEMIMVLLQKSGGKKEIVVGKCLVTILKKTISLSLK